MEALKYGLTFFFTIIISGVLFTVVYALPVGLVSGSKFVGNITQSGKVPSDFGTYWTQITCENEGKWASVESRRDTMNWSGIDRAYNYARQNGIPFKHHTFVYGRQYPSWMDNLSQTEQKEEVEEWIRLYCERYPDTELIDVVNEPDHTIPPWINALGGAGSTGYDWVIWSFEKARQHCPNATLILNDYNVLRWDTNKFISVANKVKAEGLLDAVGAEAHGLEDQPLSDLKANFNQVAEIGVPIYISEYDIDIADDSQQRAVMEKQFPFFYENSQVAGITFWGYIFGETYSDNAGLVRNGTPRPAMVWLCDYFGQDCSTVNSSADSSEHTIVIRARGTTGEEHINLMVGNEIIADWYLSSSYENYTVTTTAAGGIAVVYDNDDGGDRDVQIDYIEVDGQTRQAEDQSYNTGAYANGKCGGGSNSEWLHCEGAIGFGDV
ncbi:MAG: endo-1,4-beta-xylanase [Desulfobacteraceae bacterium]|jgi:endo-1,4-beta-xylanase